ncbi:hypothetical protein [uncultured Parabacteroides sp.]|uniref:hypothetical protein n=1 Tax=uncultured Parabacteroides sp. TaxID=512312 RepID=UPI0026217D86|nr:hypothetical protein [uncultured Parabacteroides sp.]
MKRLLLMVALLGSLNSCYAQNNDSHYKKMITDYVEVKNDVRTNLDVRISEITEKDYTVADSTEVLNSRFANEKASKIETANKDIKHYETQIAKQQAKGGLVAETLLKKYKTELEKAQNRLKDAQNWHVNYASCYDSRNPNDVIAKIVECKLSLMNPKFKTRQEGKASFLFSADGNKLLKALK